MYELKKAQSVHESCSLRQAGPAYGQDVDLPHTRSCANYSLIECTDNKSIKHDESNKKNMRKVWKNSEILSKN